MSSLRIGNAGWSDDTSLLTHSLVAANLLESNNLICFALQTVKMVAPSFTNNLFTTLAKPLNLILDTLSVPLLSLDCPSMDAIEGGGKDIVQELKGLQLPGTLGLDQGLI